MALIPDWTKLLSIENSSTLFGYLEIHFKTRQLVGEKGHAFKPGIYGFIP